MLLSTKSRTVLLVLGLSSILHSNRVFSQPVKNSTTYLWQSGTWVPFQHFRYTYTNNGQQDSSVRYKWQSSDWVAEWTTVYTYSNGLNVRTDSYMPVASTWTLAAYVLSDYTSSGQLSHYVEWARVMGVMPNMRKGDLFYDQNNYQTEVFKLGY